MKALMICLFIYFLTACEKPTDDHQVDALPDELHLTCEKIGLVSVKFVPSESATIAAATN